MTSTTLFVPAVGLDVVAATVLDVRTGREVRVGAAGAVRRRGRVFLPADSLGSENGLHLARFRGGEIAWVREGDGETAGGGRCEGCAA